jgi:hypothetical protein
VVEGGSTVPEGSASPRPPPTSCWPQAGLAAEVLGGRDADPARAAAEPGRVWRSGPAPGPSPTASPVRLWVNPTGCPSPTPTTTS